MALESLKKMVAEKLAEIKKQKAEGVYFKPAKRKI